MPLHTYDLKQLTNYHVFGRTTCERTPLTLFWTGSGIELNVRASELFLEFESGYTTYEQWISIFINGALLSRQMLTAGRQNTCIFRNMNPTMAKHVRICKEVQAMTADADSYLQIYSITTDGDFLPLKPKDIRLEIIGDSLTSGEGSIGAKEEQDWISMFFTASNGYPFLLEQLLNADVRVISQSGWGVLSSWDNNPHCTLPAVYEKICGPLSSGINARLGAQNNYEFSSWSADVILVNLGTNDDIAFEQPRWTSMDGKESFQQIKYDDGTLDSNCTSRFEQAVIQFLQTIRMYNPDAMILWVYGILGDRMKPFLKKAIQDYQQQSNDTKIKFFMLPDTTIDLIGARSHPGIVAHQRIARILADEINALIK